MKTKMFLIAISLFAFGCAKQNDATQSTKAELLTSPPPPGIRWTRVTKTPNTFDTVLINVGNGIQGYSYTITPVTDTTTYYIGITSGSGSDEFQVNYGNSDFGTWIGSANVSFPTGGFIVGTTYTGTWISAPPHWNL